MPAPTADAIAIAAATLAAEFRRSRAGLDGTVGLEGSRKEYVETYRYFLHAIASIEPLPEPKSID